MKKLFALLALAGILTLGYNTQAQDESADTTTTEVDTTTTEEAVVEETPVEEPVQQEEPMEEEVQESFHQIIKDKFIEGDWQFMTPVLLCLIIGLAISIERIITLNLATTNTDKLLATVWASFGGNLIKALGGSQHGISHIFLQLQYQHHYFFWHRIC